MSHFFIGNMVIHHDSPMDLGGTSIVCGWFLKSKGTMPGDLGVPVHPLLEKRDQSESDKCGNPKTAKTINNTPCI